MTITKAKIYEDQGLLREALLIYKEILKRDPSNKAALAAISRLSMQKPVHWALEHIRRGDFAEVKRWLMEI